MLQLLNKILSKHLKMHLLLGANRGTIYTIGLGMIFQARDLLHLGS